MRQEVDIRIKDKEAGTEIKTSGIYMKKDEKHYLFYETNEGKSRITIAPDSAEIRHAGGLVETLHVRLHKNEPFEIRTPMGDLFLSTFGKEISMIHTEGRIIFTLSYDLMEEMEVCDSHTVTLDVRKK